MRFPFEKRDYQGWLVPVPIPSYRYQKDDEHEHLRLVSIMPSHDSAALVECELFYFNLHEPPDYTALSYECGNPSEWTIIHLDGIPFPVSNNLDSALRRLRSVQSTLVWIDAISINQLDLDEKSVAIQNMSHIYHNAASVSVWLGPEADGSDQVMRMLTLIETSRRPAQLRAGNPWSPSAENVRSISKELASFFQRSYWTRVWIIQELALGSNVIIHCGAHTVTWEAIEVLLNVLEGISHSLSTCLRQVHYLSATRLSITQTRPLSLLQAMFDSAPSLATVQLDKVYALLGITFDRATYVAKPKYTITNEQLCSSMVQSVIRDHKNLDIIFTAFSGDHSILPSWCPNFLQWTQSPCLERLIPYLSGLDLRYRNGTSSYRWRASGDSHVTHDTFTINSEKIHTRGYLIGQIESLGCSLWADNALRSTNVQRAHESDEDRKIYNNMNRALTLYEPTGSSGDFSHVLYFLFTFEAKTTSTGVTTRHRSVIQWRAKNKEFVVKGKTLHTRSHGLTAAHESGELRHKMEELAVAGTNFVTYTAMAALTNGPTLMPPPFSLSAHLTTEVDMALSSLGSLISEDLRIMSTDRDAIGWAHPSADLGDQIFLLKGCSMPIILRSSKEVEGAYTVVGHAYVAGVMDGEVWCKLDPGDLQDVCMV